MQRIITTRTVERVTETRVIEVDDVTEARAVVRAVRNVESGARLLGRVRKALPAPAAVLTAEAGS